MREIIPLGCRIERHQIRFDFVRLIIRRQAKPLRNTLNVSIDHNARWFAKRNAQHHIGRLSTNTRQFNQFFERPWDLTCVLMHQSLREAYDVLGFLPVHANRSEHLFDRIQLSRCQLSRVWPTSEERRSHTIDGNIRALRTQDRRDQ